MTVAWHPGQALARSGAGAPAKYVWQYFKRYKDFLGKEAK